MLAALFRTNKTVNNECFLSAYTQISEESSICCKRKINPYRYHLPSVNVNGLKRLKQYKVKLSH